MLPTSHRSDGYFRFLILLLALVTSGSAADSEARRSFAIPAGKASETLKRFATQAGQGIVFGSENVDQINTNAVNGEFTPQEAITVMLANTGLRANRDAKSGTFAVREERPLPNVPRAAVASKALAAARDESAIVLSEFVVDTSRDSGYLARRAVSVSGLNTPVTDLAQSIEIFTEEFMLDVGAVNFDDVLAYSASLVSAEHNLEGMSPQAIRGVSNGFVLRNGFRADRVNGDATNLERAEIVKGASAILYGQSAVGGVINFVTKVPRARQRTTLSASYGSFDSMRASLDTTGPANKGKTVLYRLVASWQEMGTWIDWGFNDVKFISPKLTLVPFEKLRIDLAYENLDRKFLFAGAVPFNAADNNRPFTPAPPIDYDTLGPKGGVVQKQALSEIIATVRPFDHTTVRFAGVYRESENDRVFRGTQLGILETTGRARTGGNAGTTAAALANGQGRITRARVNGVRFDFRAEGVTDLKTRLGSTKVFYGAEYNRSGNSYNSVTPNPFFGTSTAYYSNGAAGIPAPPAYFDNFKTFLRTDPAYNAAMDGLLAAPMVTTITAPADDQWGYYGTVNHTIPGERLILSAGLRKDESNRDGSVPQFGVVFKAAPWLSAYALYGESWLAQRTSNIPLPDGTAGGYRGELRPQIGKTVEAGLKLDLGKAFVTFAAFDMETTGKSISVPNPNYNVNLPSTHINSFINVTALRGRDFSRGWEATGVVQLSEQWQTTLSFMHLKGATAAVLAAEEDVPLVGAPDNAFTLWTRFDFARGPLQGLGLGGGLKYASRRRVSGQGDFFAPSVLTYEASAFYRLYALRLPTRLQLNVKNLEDELYFWDRARYSAPLNWRLSLSTTF